METLKKPSPAKSVFVCSVIIFVLWTAYVLTLYPFVSSRQNMAWRIFLNEFFRFSIFVAPVCLWLIFADRLNPFRYLKLTENVWRGLALGLIVGGFFALIVIARAALFLPDGLAFKPVLLEAWLTVVTLSVLFEEIAFRGFILQKLGEEIPFWKANILTAILFVGVHFPGWILVGESALIPDRIISMLEIYLLGATAGYLLKRSQSLWAGVIIHATNNLISSTLFSQ